MKGTTIIAPTKKAQPFKVETITREIGIKFKAISRLYNQFKNKSGVNYQTKIKRPKKRK